MSRGALRRAEGAEIRRQRDRAGLEGTVIRRQERKSADYDNEPARNCEAESADEWARAVAASDNHKTGAPVDGEDATSLEGFHDSVTSKSPHRQRTMKTSDSPEKGDAAHKLFLVEWSRMGRSIGHKHVNFSLTGTASDPPVEGSSLLWDTERVLTVQK
jgi:hypothetical protein